MNNNLDKIFYFLGLAEKLKEVERYNATEEVNDRESSADHSWKLAIMVFVVAQELEIKIDLNRAILIALFHDLPESICGDIDYRLIHRGQVSRKEKEAKELNAALEIKKVINDKVGDEIFSLWQEYEESWTAEARFVKALDKIEAQDHLIHLGYNQFDDPTRIATYADKAVADFPDLKPLLKKIKEGLKSEYKKAGWEWEKEYN